MTTTLAKMIRMLSSVGAPVSRLRPAAAPDAVEALEHRIGSQLPAALRDCYLLHDGEALDQEGPMLGLFCDYEFLSLQEVVKTLDHWTELRTYWAQPGMDDPLNYSSHPANTVKTVLSRPGWIPFAGHYSGNHLAIDFDPASAGVAGQVINFGRDDEHHFQVSKTFGEFLELVLEHYQRGEWNQHLGRGDWSLYDELRRSFE